MLVVRERKNAREETQYTFPATATLSEIVDAVGTSEDKISVYEGDEKDPCDLLWIAEWPVCGTYIYYYNPYYPAKETRIVEVAQKYEKELSKRKPWPCKINDTVYAVYKGKVRQDTVSCRAFLGDHCTQHIMLCSLQNLFWPIEDFGKKIFFTPEEAEQACSSILDGEVNDTAGVVPEHYLHFRGDSLVCVVQYNDPTEEEMDNLRNGKVQIKLSVVDGVMVFLFKFGELEYLKALAQPNSPEQLLSDILPGAAYTLDIAFFNIHGEGGNLMFNRRFELGEEFAHILKNEYAKLRIVPFVSEDESQKAMAVLLKYDAVDILPNSLAETTPMETDNESFAKPE